MEITDFIFRNKTEEGLVLLHETILGLMLCDGCRAYRRPRRYGYDEDGDRNIKKFKTEAKELNKKITAKEVKTAVKKMANNKVPGKDNINVELIKYAPEETYKEIANIINGIYERNDTSIKLGTGILLPIPKPKKTQGPVKNLRPIILLEVIRKILSNIFMDS